MENTELHKAIEEAIRDLNDTDVRRYPVGEGIEER